MEKYLLILTLSIGLASCKVGTGSDRQYEGGNDKNLYKLGLNPEPGKIYRYEISNESSMNVKAGGRQINNENRSEIIVDYILDKDSAGNFSLKMKYQRIHVFLKNGDNKTDISSENAGSPGDDPMEKMLGALKEVVIEAVITPAGEVKSVKGYNELADKIITGFNASGVEGRIAREKLDQSIGEDMVKKNIDQLFKIFPDSMVHTGDKWKLGSRQGGELPFDISSFYTLSHINDQEAVFSSEGKISTDNTALDFSNTKVMARLEGVQEGKYKVERKTGMITESENSLEINGTMLAMGQELPLSIKNKVEVKRKKNN